MLTAVNHSMTLYKLKFCTSPEKFTYTFVKEKNMGLPLLFKVYYFREYQASHSTRKCLRSQSVLQTFTSSLSLATAKSPHWHWDRSRCSLARAQRLGLTQHQLHTHTLHPAHTVPATAPTLAPSYQTYPHSFSCREHQHCKPRASTRALLIPSAPPIPS